VAPPVTIAVFSLNLPIVFFFSLVDKYSDLNYYFSIKNLNKKW
jgi:hypothetical protein